MGEDWGSPSPWQHIDWKPSNLNCSGSPLGFGKQYTAPTCLSPATETISVKANELHGWFYGLPQLQQAFSPALNYGFKEKFPIAPCDDNIKVSMPQKVESVHGQKKFLVFDQSGDQTTLIFGSSGIKTPVGCFTSLGTNTAAATCNLKTEGPTTKDVLNIHLGAVATDQYAKDSKADVSGEMHEDTDELNALLYSDDESDCGEDDEVTSTGHSPSTMTVHDKPNWFEGGIEGAGSSNGSSKKRKLFEVLPALLDTASSVKRECEDDAESRCENKKICSSNHSVSEPENKKMRKDKIRETVNILQSIIPCGKGKDAIGVIDEAINYLKSLKMKAEALGLNAP